MPSHDFPLSRRALSLAGLGACFAAGCQHGAPTGASAEDERIAALLIDWVDARRQCLGVAAGVVDLDAQKTYAHGVLGLSDPRAVDAETVFGIASLTKVFTGLLLCDAVLRGEMRLQDPARPYLPDAPLPTRDGREVCLIDLATHTSGFPQEIPDYAAAASAGSRDPNQPLFDFLADFALTRPIGEAWSYSNINYALLGIALSHRTGRTYDALIAERIADPLGMSSTGVALTSAMRARRASPHLDVSTPAPEWNKPWSLGAGALQSTAADLSRFLAAACGLRRTRLTPAFAAMLETTRPSSFLGGDQAIGWGIDRSAGDPRVFFGGRAPGFTSVMMFDPLRQRGVAALANSSLMVEALGREILRPGSTAQETAPARPAPPDLILDRLVGRYALDTALTDARFAAGDIVEVSRTSSGIAVQLPRYPLAELSRLADGSYEIAGFPVQLSFPEGTSPAVEFTLSVAGQSAVASRR